MKSICMFYLCDIYICPGYVKFIWWVCYRNWWICYMMYVIFLYVKQSMLCLSTLIFYHQKGGVWISCKDLEPLISTEHLSVFLYVSDDIKCSLCRHLESWKFQEQLVLVYPWEWKDQLCPTQKLAWVELVSGKCVGCTLTLHWLFTLKLWIRYDRLRLLCSLIGEFTFTYECSLKLLQFLGWRIHPLLAGVFWHYVLRGVSVIFKAVI